MPKQSPTRFRPQIHVKLQASQLPAQRETEEAFGMKPEGPCCDPGPQGFAGPSGVAGPAKLGALEALVVELESRFCPLEANLATAAVRLGAVTPNAEPQGTTVAKPDNTLLARLHSLLDRTAVISRLAETLSAAI